MQWVSEDRCDDSPLSRATSRPTKPVSSANHLITLVVGANFRSKRLEPVAVRGQAIYESFSFCYEAYRVSSPTSFNFHRLSHYPHKLDRYTMSSSRPLTPATGSTVTSRRTSPLPRAEAVGLKSSSKDIPLGLPCLTFGPLIFAISQAFRRPTWCTRQAQATIAGTTAAALSVWLLSFGIWQQWFLSGLFIGAGFVVLAARQSAAAPLAPLRGAE